jgi:hypothetical protein
MAILSADADLNTDADLNADVYVAANADPGAFTGVSYNPDGSQ